MDSSLYSYSEFPWHHRRELCCHWPPPRNLKDKQEPWIALCSTDRTPRAEILFLRLHSSWTGCVSRAQLFVCLFVLFVASFQGQCSPSTQWLQLFTTKTLNFRSPSLSWLSEFYFPRVTLNQIPTQRYSSPSIFYKHHLLLDSLLPLQRLGPRVWLHRSPRVIDFGSLQTLTFPLATSGRWAWLGLYGFSCILPAIKNPVCALIQHSPLRLGEAFPTRPVLFTVPRPPSQPHTSLKAYRTSESQHIKTK